MNCGARGSDVEQALRTGTLVLILLNIYSTAYSTVATIVCKVLVLIYFSTNTCSIIADVLVTRQRL